MKIRFITLNLLLVLMATVSFAQQEENTEVDSTSAFSIHSVNFTLGYYSPEMDYWNDTYLPAKGFTDDFGGFLTLGGNLTFALPSDFRARLGVLYGAKELDGGTNASIDALKISLTRITYGLMYAPKNMSFNGFQPYAGVQAQSVFINNTYTVNKEEIEQSGSDLIFAPLVGVDRNFGTLNIGAELKYNVGSYVQEETVEGTVEHDVALNGIEFALTIGYRF